MRRITVSLVLVLALLAAPAAVSAHGPSIDPDGLAAATTSCDGEDCGDYGPTIDPNGLAALPKAQEALASWLGWLRAFLPV